MNEVLQAHERYHIMSGGLGFGIPRLPNPASPTTADQLHRLRRSNLTDYDGLEGVVGRFVGRDPAEERLSPGRVLLAADWPAVCASGRPVDACQQQPRAEARGLFVAWQ